MLAAASATLGVPSGWPYANSLLAVAISSTPWAITRLPPPAWRSRHERNRVAHQRCLPRPDDFLIEHVDRFARWPIYFVAGQNSPAVAVRRLLGPAGHDLAPRHRSTTDVAAGDQVAAADAQQVHGVGRQVTFPQHLSAGGVKGQDGLAVRRGDEQHAAMVDARIQVAIEMGRPLACPDEPARLARG